MSRLEFLLDIAWPGLRVSVTSITEEWAAMSVAGPKSCEIQFRLSNEALPHMGLLEENYRERPLRI
ncbi:MAG: hypothetical protein E5Y16_33960, partial [Mesorhizobium sp.]